MRLGAHIQATVTFGTTNKGPWRSSKQQALSNDYLKSVVSLREGWIKLHHSRRNTLCGPACRVL